jgi:hypothetical protein
MEVPFIGGMTTQEASPSLPTDLLEPPNTYIDQSKAFVADKCYHMAITTNIHVNSMARWVEGM